MTYFLRKKYYILLVVLIISLNVFLQKTIIYAEEYSELSGLYSISYCVMVAANGRILEEKDSQKELANASTTKILTCIIVLENCNINEYARVSKNASQQPNVKLGVKENEQYKIKDLLYSMMLESFNDCAYVLGEFVAGDIKSFSQIMNKKASEIGCKHTYFITPNGLDAKDKISFHHSTAQDLCTIMKYCTWLSPKAKEFKEITQTLQYTFDLPNKNNIVLSNHNRLLQENCNIISGKTGFTSAAGYCYVGAYEKNGIKYCFCLLACGWPNNKNYKWIDSKKIIDHIECNYQTFVASDPNLIFEQKKFLNSTMYYNGKIDIEKWNSNCENEFIFSDISKNILVRKNEIITEQIIINSSKKAEYKRNEVIGEIIYKNNNECIAKCKIFLNNDIYKWNIISLFSAIIIDYIMM